MRPLAGSMLAVACLIVVGLGLPAEGQTSKDKAKDKTKDKTKEARTADQPKPTGMETPPEYTRTILLKTKVSGSYENETLGEILKDLADQVDMKGEKPVMWTYGMGFPYTQKVTYSCDEKPLDAVLDKLLSKAGGLGYVVIAKPGDKYDGWVRLTTTGERGMGSGEPSAADEAAAAEKLALAKKLLDAGKTTSAKPLLDVLTKKYPNTKAGAEAKALLDKLDK